MKILQTMVILLYFPSSLNSPSPPSFKNEIFHPPVQVILKTLYPPPLKREGAQILSSNSLLRSEIHGKHCICITPNKYRNARQRGGSDHEE